MEQASERELLGLPIDVPLLLFRAMGRGAVCGASGRGAVSGSVCQRRVLRTPFLKRFI